VRWLKATIPYHSNSPTWLEREVREHATRTEIELRPYDPKLSVLMGDDRSIVCLSRNVAGIAISLTTAGKMEARAEVSSDQFNRQFGG
jgi:hypothetical protein